MSSTIVFNATEMAFAVTVFCVIAFIEPFVEHKLHASFADNSAFQWGWDQFFAPLIRVLSLVVFIYLAYPAVLGLSVAPTIGDLLAADEVDINTWIGAVFFAGFLLSLTPGLGHRPEYVLPLQGSLALAYVFYWLTSYLGITTATFWPGLDIVLMMILVAYFAHRIARALGHRLGNWIDMRVNTRGYDIVVSHVIDLLAQIPVIVLYGVGLGRQLAI